MSEQKILILGITGMLGHKIFQILNQSSELEVFGTIRQPIESLCGIDIKELGNIYTCVDADNFKSFEKIILDLKPDMVINCIGIIKQLPLSSDPLITISINSLFPHQVAAVCKKIEARMLHISTDCIFNGLKGQYIEKDSSDAFDLYGKTKYLGELKYKNCLTLRTSIIGHELISKYGLVEWFLSQKVKKVKGFKKAIFSGFPTIELARIIKKYVIPNTKLNGLYHVSSSPISKYNLIKLIADKYKKEINIESDNMPVCDRSLNSDLFRNNTSYIPSSWPELIEAMYEDYITSSCYKK